MPFGPKGLVVTWVGPVPDQAEVSYADNSIFAAAAKANGTDTPTEFPRKYLQALQRVDLFNASMSWNAQAVKDWEKRYGIEMETEPLSIFEQYIKSGHAIFSTLVRHPSVRDPQLFRRCSVVLQRAVIVLADGREDLYLKSYFHSAKDENTYVNFVPSGGLHVSFKSDAIWFPLELTRVIQEPYSYVVLDLLTTGTLDEKQVPKPFLVGKRGTMTLTKQQFQALRVTAKLPAKERAPDLNIPVQNRPPAAK